MNNSNVEAVVGEKAVSIESIFSNKTTQLLAALLFGLVVIAVVGLLPMDIVHSAAHDVRHVHAFPCH